ncbi:fic family toxin-antitoxin system, toxin component [Kitasatospora sp. NPDC056138]|uniref:fic family toxin-antitoxin system, toxin component n=1 Tax=Kitasatospora sp. NPDC056138 TaxID=3345724 RepID=UPI0035D7556F
MILHVDLAWILEVAERAVPGDPAPIDYGVAIAAVERHRAVVTGQDVYDGPVARAAALTHTLGRLPWLEHSNLRVAVAVAHGYLTASGVQVRIDQERVTALATALTRPRATVADIAAVLRTWRT